MGIYLFKREALERLLAEEPEAPPPKGAPPAPPGGSDVHFGYVRSHSRAGKGGTASARAVWVQALNVIFHH